MKTYARIFGGAILAAALPAAPALAQTDDEAAVRATGNAAVAKVILDYPKARFTDYFTLLKIGGEWKIVNKSFHVEPKGD